MSGLNVFVDRKTFYVAVLLILPSVIAVLVLTTLKKLEKVCYFGQNAVLFDGIRRPIKW